MTNTISTYTLKVQNAGRLDEFLRKELPVLLHAEISNSKIRRLIVAGAVKINGLQEHRPFANLQKDFTVKLTVDSEKLFFEKQPEDIKFELTEENVLYEDEFIIVVNKPAFFPTEQTIVASRDNLHNAIIRYLHKKNPQLRNPPYAGIMHRLDRETSGVILFTKTRTVNAACHNMFEHHTAQKIYCAVVAPEFPVKEGSTFSVEFTMGRISGKSQAAKWGNVPASKGGLPSKTEFKILSKTKSGKYYFVQCSLFTGRTHQIRVHLASRKMPLLGDKLYGGKSFSRIMLHAESLTFPHPVTNNIITVTAPLPEEFLHC